ncbi:hypothetical protein EZV62_023808 [Acer yangbiense]|uniref:KIB1-4 beta-propeller domain-containing protein n=1 Tax=Acer yangbiense TaxID=1000413 RepID=A0A5C7H2P2_9ROSI|nr:hypothetical protein EZV62_023808 [Acer yangbiense]
MASTSWRAAASEKKDDFKFKSPCLLFAPEKDTNLCNFFSFQTETVARQLTSPELQGKKYLSSKGWILTITQDWSSTTLFHPCSRLQIQLPKVTMIQDWDDDYVRKLAYYKSSDEAWTRIDTWYGAVSDFTFYNGKLYAIDYLGRIMSCDIEGDNPTIGQLGTTLPGELVHNILEKLYIVESSESDTLLVISQEGVQVRPIDEEAEEERYTYGTYAFQVFKVYLSTNTWIEIKDLGNRAVFLGHNSSFSFEASDISGCKSNCIYFTDDCQESYSSHEEQEGEEQEEGEDFRIYDVRDGTIVLHEGGGGGKDIGIYDIRDGTIVSHFKCDSYHPINPPMWLE